MSGTDLLCSGAAPTSAADADRSGSSDSDGANGECCLSVMGDEARMLKPGGGGGGGGTTQDGGGGGGTGDVDRPEVTVTAADGRSSWRPPDVPIGAMAQPCMLGLLVRSIPRPVLFLLLRDFRMVGFHTVLNLWIQALKCCFCGALNASLDTHLSSSATKCTTTPWWKLSAMSTVEPIFFIISKSSPGMLAVASPADNESCCKSWSVVPESTEF